MLFWWSTRVPRRVFFISSVRIVAGPLVLIHKGRVLSLSLRILDGVVCGLCVSNPFSGMLKILFVRRYCRVYMSEPCVGMLITFATIYCSGLFWILMYIMEFSVCVSCRCMSASLWYVLNNSPPSLRRLKIGPATSVGLTLYTALRNVFLSWMVELHVIWFVASTYDYELKGLTV